MSNKRKAIQWQDKTHARSSAKIVSHCATLKKQSKQHKALINKLRKQQRIIAKLKVRLANDNVVSTKDVVARKSDAEKLRKLNAHFNEMRADLIKKGTKYYQSYKPKSTESTTCDEVRG